MNKINVSYHKGNIVEYDMVSANINILLSKGLIDADTYRRIYGLSKLDRVIEIGNLQRERPEVNTCIMEEIPKVIDKFIAKHNITKDEIVIRVRDAIYVNREEPIEDLEVEDLEFSDKNKYTSCLIYDNGFKILFNSNDNTIDVKGIKDSKIHLLNSFINMLKRILIIKENDDEPFLYNTIHSFIYNYKNETLPIEYYKEFNSSCMYNYGVSSSDLPIDGFNNLSKEFNLRFLNSLCKILL